MTNLHGAFWVAGGRAEHYLGQDGVPEDTKSAESGEFNHEVAGLHLLGIDTICRVLGVLSLRPSKYVTDISFRHQAPFDEVEAGYMLDLGLDRIDRTDSVLTVRYWLQTPNSTLSTEFLAVRGFEPDMQTAGGYMLKVAERRAA